MINEAVANRINRPHVVCHLRNQRTWSLDLCLTHLMRLSQSGLTVPEKPSVDEDYLNETHFNLQLTWLVVDVI
jgi:hypothetical protein